MVSKQDKYLRQQATLRAEKYKDEQAKKIASHAPANNTTTSTKSATSMTASKIEPTLGAAAERQSPPPGQSSDGDILTGIANPQLPDLAREPRATPSKDDNALFPAERTSSKKALASKTKEPHVPVAFAPCEPLGASQKTAGAARSDVQSALTSYSIVGGVESDFIARPPVSSPRTPIRTAGSSTERDTFPPFISSSHNDRAPNRGHAKNDHSPVVLETDFTFRPMIPISHHKQPTPPPGTSPSFKIPPRTATLVGDPMKLGSTRGIMRPRSIFDVLYDRSKLATSSVSSQVAMPNMATDGIATAGDDLHQDSTPEPAHVANLQDHANARVDTEDLHLVNPGEKFHDMVTAGSPQRMVLILSSQISLLPPDLEVIPLLTILRLSEPAETWRSHRIFFAAADGHTRLVDFEQTMYDVDVVEDDGGSDFDSIASPAKFSPAKFDPRLSLLGEDIETTSSSNEAETEFDVEDLAELRRFGCPFVTCDSETIAGTVTPATTNSFSDDEEMMNSSLCFQKLEIARTAAVVMPASLESATTSNSKNDLDISLTDDEFDLSRRSLIENPTENICILSPSRPLTADRNPDVLQPSFVSDDDSEQACNFEEPTIDTRGVPHIGVFHGLLPTHTTTKYTGHVEEIEEATDSDIVPSDWASEIVRMTLGTESLFTFLDHLDSSDEVSTNKLSIAGAFLELVNLERSKLSQRSLSQACTVSVVMASKIIPHTIFLGTTSLASFLSHFKFDEDSRTTIDDVHRVFEAVSREDLCLQIKARTGIMGALGRRLGRLPVA